MSKNNNYNASDIVTLTDREHVRKRTQIYLGSTKLTTYYIPLFVDDNIEIKTIDFVPAVYKAVGEIIDNCIDEFAQIDIPNKHLLIEANPLLGTYKISDNGRGIPIDKHPSGNYTPEVALGSLRSGRNFEDELAKGVIGQNGVGSACTNFCSTDFRIDITRDGKRYRQTFTNGAETVSKPSVRNTTSNKTGTTVEFQLDSQVFEDPTLPSELMENRAIELAFTNPGVTVQYNNNKYKFKKGLEDVVKRISNEYHKFEIDGMQFFVIFDSDIKKDTSDQIFTWVNSSLLFDGGLCNTQFINAFTTKTIKHLGPQAKKEKCEVTKTDILPGLLVLGNLHVSKPEYDAQSKTRLTGPCLRKEISAMIDDQWSSFARKNKKWLGEVFERAHHRHNISATKKAINEHKKNRNKRVPGLVDATSKNRMECQLLITEGDSAASMITQARDPKTTASLPLRGKINNVYGMTPAFLLRKNKMTDLLTAVGLIPGQKAVRSNLRYGKIVIATDADYDGGDIFTLLVNFFYVFWPELFDPNYDSIVYRMVAPNVCAIKGNKRVHFPTRLEYEKVKNKYKGWEIKYYKGLGSLQRQDWNMMLSGESNTLIPILDDGKVDSVLELLFSSQRIEERKQWLQN